MTSCSLAFLLGTLLPAAGSSRHAAQAPGAVPAAAGRPVRFDDHGAITTRSLEAQVYFNHERATEGAVQAHGLFGSAQGTIR